MHRDATLVGAALVGVYDLTLRTTEVVTPVLEKHGLTFNNSYVLWALDPSDPPPSMAALARRTRCTPPNLTFLCDQLESRGFITRARSATDGRQRVVHLTPAGRSARAAIIEQLVASSPLRSVPEDDLIELARIVTTICDNPST